MRPISLAIALIAMIPDPSWAFAQENKDPSDELFAAVRAGRLETVTKWIASGRELNDEDTGGRTGLSAAIEWGRLDIARALLDAGARIDRGFGGRENGALFSLAHWDSTDLIDAFLAKGISLAASKDDSGRTPLHIAAMYDRARLCAKLLDRGAALEAVDDDGRTALHIAALYGAPDAVKCLIARGANVLAADRVGNTPLHLCAYDGHANVASAMFLDATRHDIGLRDRLGAARNRHGWTALHVAVASDQLGCARVLRSFGETTGMRTSSGASTQHLAAAFGGALELDWVGVGKLGSRERLDDRDASGRTPEEILRDRSAFAPMPHELDRDAVVRLRARIATTSSDDSSIVRPLVLRRALPGYPGPRPVDLVTFAVWADGVVVFAAPGIRDAELLRVGSIEPDRVRVLLDELDEFGFFDAGDWNRVGMHDPSTRVVAERGDKVCTQEFDGHLDPTWPMDSREAAPDPVSLAAWRWANAWIDGSVPRESTALAELRDVAQFERRIRALGIR